MPPSKHTDKPLQGNPPQTAPNTRVLPKNSSHPVTAPKKKKEDIPYEIKNAREWDPNRKHQAGDSSESSDDDEDYYESDYGERPQGSGDVSSTQTDDGFQLVVDKRFQPNVNAHGQPPSHPKAHPHGKPKGQRQPRLRVDFNYKRDNLARAAFRKRLNPTGKFMLPRDCVEIEPDRKKMYDKLEEIGVRLGSFIRPPQNVKDRELLLWGDARQVQMTIAELQRWLNIRLQPVSERKPAARDKFAKELSSIGNLHHQLMKRMQKDAKILEFQQVPARGRVFLYPGAFDWPVDEVRPEDILGSSLEAFDPIRFQYQCHIIFDTKLSLFRIYSDKEESVEKTMARIIGTMKEYVAKSARPENINLVEPPSSSTVRKDVKIVPASLDNPKADKDSMIPVLTGSTLSPEARKEWLTQRSQLIMKNNRRMELSLRKCIANLIHYRGVVRMRVQFGTFALKVFRWKDETDFTPLGEFMDNTAMSETKGVIIRDLRIQKDAPTIVSKVQKAADLFLPTDNCATSLENCVPSFSACFEFRPPDSAPMSLTVEWSSSPFAPNVYTKVKEMWTRKDRRDNAVPLEAFMARLDSGEASWKLQVANETSIDPSRISSQMTSFADSVKLSKIPGTRTELTGHRVFTWEKGYLGVMQPTAFEQKTALKYRLARAFEWEFEIARYDSYGNAQKENVPVETNWGATLYNSYWDSVLTANSTLGIGEAAPWDPMLDTLFPCPSTSGIVDMRGVEGLHPGVTEFLKNVEVVTKFLDTIKKELPHLRG